MDQFAYLSVLISIILGLALAQLLTGIGRLIQFRARIDFYWPTVLWAATLLVIDVQSWWALFSIRDYHSWTFFSFLALLLHPLALYLLAALALPDLPDYLGVGRIDLKHHYFAHSRWYFATILLTIGASVARPLMLGAPLMANADTITQLLLFVLATIAIFTTREWYHQALAVVFPLTLAVYVGLLFTRL